MVNVFKISLIIFKCASVIKVIFINNQVMMDIFANGQQISYSKLNYLLNRECLSFSKKKK